ncbi:MAG: hypothetical protein IPI05_04995 [Flavobacteriales bacterium]|nr:hypothetical protein [Flavobacteriales bacterium]
MAASCGQYSISTSKKLKKSNCISQQGTSVITPHFTMEGRAQREERGEPQGMAVLPCRASRWKHRRANRENKDRIICAHRTFGIPGTLPRGGHQAEA